MWREFVPTITYGDSTIRDGDPVVWLDEQGIPQEADEEHPHGVLIGRTADESPLGHRQAPHGVRQLRSGQGVARTLRPDRA